MKAWHSIFTAAAMDPKYEPDTILAQTIQESFPIARLEGRSSRSSRHCACYAAGLVHTDMHSPEAMKFRANGIAVEY